MFRDLDDQRCIEKSFLSFFVEAVCKRCSKKGQTESVYATDHRLAQEYAAAATAVRLHRKSQTHDSDLNTSL